MAHPNVALDVEGWSPGEPEGLHVGVDHRLVHGVPLGQGALELWDQLVILGTSEMRKDIFFIQNLTKNWVPMVIDELNFFVCTVMGVAVIDEDVESVPLGSGIFRINI